MSERVRFKNPPVVEVLCGVLFSTLTGLRTAHVGLYWSQIRKSFPLVEEAPPLAPMIEAYEPINSLEVEVGFVPPLARTWFHTADRGGLIQLQRDRFVYNWRRPSPSEGDYPSYDNVIVDFERQWETFCDFVSQEGLGEIAVRQLELAYINIIPSDSVPAGDPVFVDHAVDLSRDRFLKDPDQFAWRTSYMLPDNAGRLHVQIASGRHTDTGDPIRRLDMVARGISNDAVPSMRDWFNLAHEWIVNGFADVTTSSMQETVWRRQS